MGSSTHLSTGVIAAKRERRAGRSPPSSPSMLSTGGSAADRAADAVELVAGVLAQDGHGRDADHRDQGHEEGVLHQRGATLRVAEASPKPRGKVVIGEHWFIRPWEGVDALPLSVGRPTGLRRRALELRRQLVSTGEPTHDHVLEVARVVDVLLVGPATVAGVLQEGEVVGLVEAAVAGVDHPVPDLAHDPAPLLVDHVPLDREVAHVPVHGLGHGRGDPGPDGLAAAEGPVEVFDVGGILGEQIGPGVPVAARPRRQGHGLVVGERLLQLVPRPPSHQLPPCSPSAAAMAATTSSADAPGVSTTATPAAFRSSMSASGMIPPTTTGASTPAALAASTMRGASVVWPPLCMEMPMRSASSCWAAATTVSVVWRRPR